MKRLLAAASNARRLCWNLVSASGSSSTFRYKAINRNGRVDTNGLEGNPLSNDSDGDGLSDTQELDALGLMRCVTDSDCDDDGLDDGRELSWNVDSDQDGLVNFVDPDADNDGVPDGLEGLGVFNGDADGDGIKNMLDKDSDNDGFLDGIEDKAPYGVLSGLDLNPLLADLDGDGIIDGLDLNPVSALPLLGLDLDAFRMLDKIDTWPGPAYQAELYIGKVWVTTDRAGSNEVFKLDFTTLQDKDGFGSGNYIMTGPFGRLDNFAPSVSLDVPQDIRLFTPDIPNRDVKMYLWINAYDWDPGADDQLDIGNAATPVWGAGGKSYSKEISLRQDLFQNWRELTDINGASDGGRGDEDDARFGAKFLEDASMEHVTQLIKHSQLV